MKVSFAKAVWIYAAAICVLLAGAIMASYWFDSRPVDIEPLAVYAAPAEIYRQSQFLNESSGVLLGSSSAFAARNFSEARALMESGVGLSSYDGRSLLRAASNACDGYDPLLRPEQWTRSLLYPAVEGRGHAMRSLQMTVYFQSMYCDGVASSNVIVDRGQFLSEMSEIAEQTHDQDTLDLILLMSDFWDGSSSEERVIDMEGFSSLVSRTGSPAVFYEAIGVLFSQSPDFLNSQRHEEVLSDDLEIRQAKSAAIALAHCEIFEACPPMGVILMANCVPYRCPPDGTMRGYLESQYSDAVMEAAEAMKNDIVEWRRQAGG